MAARRRSKKRKQDEEEDEEHEGDEGEGGTEDPQLWWVEADLEHEELEDVLEEMSDEGFAVWKILPCDPKTGSVTIVAIVNTPKANELIYTGGSE